MPCAHINSLYNTEFYQYDALSNNVSTNTETPYQHGLSDLEPSYSDKDSSHNNSIELNCTSFFGFSCIDPKKLFKCHQNTKYSEEDETSDNRIVVNDLALGGNRLNEYLKKIKKSKLIVERIKYMCNVADMKKIFRFAPNNYSIPKNDHNLGEDPSNYTKPTKEDFKDIPSKKHNPQIYKGFLFIGFGNIDHESVWNRRWCVLEDTTIEYYKNQSDEESHCPMGVIYLQCCKISDDDINTCLGNKIVCLLDNSEFERIYISPDSPLEIVEWVIEV